MTIYNYISFDHIHENYNYNQQAQSNKYCQLSDYHETTIKYLNHNGNWTSPQQADIRKVGTTKMDQAIKTLKDRCSLFCVFHDGLSYFAVCKKCLKEHCSD